MATAKDIFKRSLRIIGVLDAGEEPTAAESQDCLTALNAMLALWSTQRLYVHAIKIDSLTWGAGFQSRTIGSSGNFNTTRPTKIEDSTFYTSAGNDYPLTILDSFREYTSIVDKGTESNNPWYLYYNPVYPLGVLYLWPVPISSLTLTLHSTQQLGSLAAITTTFDMAPGYEDAIVFSLAERLAPEFGVALSPEIVKTGAANRRAIKRLNAPTPILYTELDGVGSGSIYDIDADES